MAMLPLLSINGIYTAGKPLASLLPLMLPLGVCGININACKYLCELHITSCTCPHAARLRSRSRASTTCTRFEFERTFAGVSLFHITSHQ